MSASDDSQTLVALLEQALKHWHREDMPIPLADTLPRLKQQVETSWPGRSTLIIRQIVNQLLLDLLEKLTTFDVEAATLLRRRYINDETGFAIANSLGISESSFYRRRREALLALAEIAQAQEHEALVAHTSRLESRLESPSYHHLVGVTKLCRRLSQLLNRQADIKLICLVGMGGIGKTALADTLARQAIAGGEFDDLAWITARQQQFAPWGEIQETNQPVLTPNQLVIAIEQQLSRHPAPPRPPAERLAGLKSRLAKNHHLIILDNLETAEDYQALLPLLRELSQFAWLLLTSRVGIYEQPGIHITNLTELRPTDAEALVRDEAARRGIDDLAQASPEALTQIYATVGGNPLALKLIVGQVQVRSLPTVLADLNEARGGRVEALYEFIYRRAWELLDDTARRVLLTMPLVASPGTKLDHLAGATGLSDDRLYDALEDLIRLSLVNVGGSLDQRRYSIHRLTETFLHKQVSKWV